jgi:hypothetical protein
MILEIEIVLLGWLYFFRGVLMKSITKKVFLKEGRL